MALSFTYYHHHHHHHHCYRIMCSSATTCARRLNTYRFYSSTIQDSNPSVGTTTTTTTTTTNNNDNNTTMTNTVNNEKQTTEAPPVKKKRRVLVPLKEPFKLTDTAAERVRYLMSKQQNAVGLRISINRRGCNGLTTVLNYVYSDNIPKFHEEVTDKGIKIYVEPSSLMYVLGTVMDYVDTDIASEFVFNNPNAQSTCGCGESVSVPDKVARMNQKIIEKLKEKNEKSAASSSLEENPMTT
jgi:iron-sulfur cluster assembly accessory protein